MRVKSVATFRPTLTRELFLQWISARLQGETRANVGRSLGVTGAAVNRWLSGASGVSDTVLLLAELLRRAPVDLPAGLPSDGPPGGS